MRDEDVLIPHILDASALGRAYPWVLVALVAAAVACAPLVLVASVALVAFPTTFSMKGLAHVAPQDPPRGASQSQTSP